MRNFLSEFHTVSMVRFSQDLDSNIIPTSKASKMENKIAFCIYEVFGDFSSSSMKLPS